MAVWSAEFREEAEHDLVKLDKTARRRVIEKIDWLISNFDSIFPISLRGEYREFYKLRVGDWRIFYKIDWKNNLITVYYIEHRTKAYKKKRK